MASDPREAYQRLIQELQHRARQGGSGGGIPNLPRGFRSGGGAIVALVAGGLLLSSSLYNGKPEQDVLLSSVFYNSISGRWP
jgi:hypothetical protein